jgi:hypothetical protein
MDNDEQFNRLASRDTELTTLTGRGRRRALEIMVLACLPSPFLVMWLNNDSSLESLIPIGIACLGGISYSWAKWKRRPEDSQSVAFIGLDRRRRGETYRSIWRGSAIEDPVVLTIVESIDDHLRRSVWPVVAAIVSVAAMAIVLVEVGDGTGSGLSPAIVIGCLAAAAIASHRWVMNRMGTVLDQSRLL